MKNKISTSEASWEMGKRRRKLLKSHTQRLLNELYDLYSNSFMTAHDSLQDLGQKNNSE